MAYSDSVTWVLPLLCCPDCGAAIYGSQTHCVVITVVGMAKTPRSSLPEPCPSFRSQSQTLSSARELSIPSGY